MGQVCGEGRWKRGGVVFVKETRHVAICKRDNSSSRGTPTFPSHGASCASPVERLWSRSDRGPAAVELKPSTMLRRSKAMAAFHCFQHTRTVSVCDGYDYCLKYRKWECRWRSTKEVK